MNNGSCIDFSNCAYICIYEGKRCQEPRNTEKTEKKKQKKSLIWGLLQLPWKAWKGGKVGQKSANKAFNYFFNSKIKLKHLFIYLLFFFNFLFLCWFYAICLNFNLFTKIAQFSHHNIWGWVLHSGRRGC